MKTNFLGNVYFMQGNSSLVSGKVIDISTNNPMNRVHVYVKESPSIGTSTTSDGRFSLNLTGPGTIMFSHLGYETFDYPSHDVPSTVYLSPKAEPLDEVVVIAHKDNKWKYLGYLGLAVAAFLVTNEVMKPRQEEPKPGESKPDEKA